MYVNTLEECEYIMKEKDKYINNDSEISPDNSEQTNSNERISDEEDN